MTWLPANLSVHKKSTGLPLTADSNLKLPQVYLLNLDLLQNAHYTGSIASYSMDSKGLYVAFLAYQSLVSNGTLYTFLPFRNHNQSIPKQGVFD